MARQDASTIPVLRKVSLSIVIAFSSWGTTAKGQMADALFVPVMTYSTAGFHPTSVAVADVNDDGKPDLIVAGCELTAYPCATSDGDIADGVLSVMLGNGNGTFAAPVNYRSGAAQATSVVVSDVNADSKPDLVVANRGPIGTSTTQPGVVSVLLGNGDGTFRPPLTYDSGGFSASSVKVADLNRDGRADLLVANSFEASHNSQNGAVGVLLGNGDGTFADAVTYSSGDSIVVGDINGDDKIDMVVSNAACPDTNGAPCAGVLLGNGDGTFQSVVTYRSGVSGPSAWITSIALADLNGDGTSDLVATNTCYCANPVSVLLGNGDGTFQPAKNYGSGGGAAWSVAVANVKGDDKPDLLVGYLCTGDATTGCNNFKSVIGLLVNNGDGTFQSALMYKSNTTLTVFLAAANVNGGNAPDLVVTSEGDAITAGAVTVWLNTTDFHLTTTKLVSSRNPSVVGQAVILKATVSSTVGPPPDGERVTFRNESALLGTAPLSNGIASWLSPSLPVGAFNITASYEGDANFGVSTSPSLQQVVKSTSQFGSSVTVASSLNPSIYGQTVTWMARVTSAGSSTPTGRVVFSALQFGRPFTIGTATLNASGLATLTRANLNGSYTYPITAVYVGDALNAGSRSLSVSQVVKQATTAASLTSLPNPSVQGQAVTFKARITSPTVIAKGPVTFTMGNTVLGTAPLSGGKASLTVSTLPVGSIRVKVTYFGNSNIAKSSASVIQTVH